MLKISIGSEPKQKINVLFEDTQIVLNLTYRPTIASWTMNLEYKDEPLILGKKLTMGISLLRQLNKPFDILLLEKQNTGIDPFKQDDFIDRVEFFILEREELKEIRGYDVI